MTTSNAAYLLAAAAVSAPMLFVEAAHAGVPIKAYVSPSHVAALATLRGPILFDTLGLPLNFAPKTTGDHYVDSSAASWLGLVVNSLGPFRPGSGRNAVTGHYAMRKFKCTKSDAETLVARVLAAVSSGLSVTAPPMLYRIVRTSPFRPWPGTAEDNQNQRNVFANIARGDYESEAGFTALGTALVTLAVRHARMLSGGDVWPNGWDDDRSPPAIMEALADVVTEMDTAGLSIEGKPVAPPDDSVLGGIAHAASASLDFVLGVPLSVGGSIAGAAATAALSTTGLLAIAGYLAYRAVKS